MSENPELPSKIACPACGGFESDVKDSRGANNAIRRRRTCCTCSNRFTTFETTEGVIDSGTQREIRILISRLEEMQGRLTALLKRGSDETG